MAVAGTEGAVMVAVRHIPEAVMVAVAMAVALMMGLAAVSATSWNTARTVTAIGGTGVITRMASAPAGSATMTAVLFGPAATTSRSYIMAKLKTAARSKLPDEVIRDQVGTASFIKSIASEKGIAINYGWTVVASCADHDLWGTVDVNEVSLMEFLHAGAAAELPPGTRYQIRERIPGFHGRAFGRAWFWSPEFSDAAEWGTKEPGIPPECGYKLIGEYVTPTAKAAAV
jgi:hypothetical protein